MDDETPHTNVFDRLTDKVTAASSIPDSVQQLMRNLAVEIRTCAGNESACRSLADGIERDASRFHDHVMAGTPVVVGTHPAPASRATAHGHDETDKKPSSFGKK